MSFTVTSALRWWVRQGPDTLALNVDGTAVTYGELYRWAKGAAGWLQEQGVKPGDRVGMLSVQSVPYIALALGLQLTGAMIVPLNTRFTARELRVAIDDTTPLMVFAEPERIELIQHAVEGMSIPVKSTRYIDSWRERPAFTPTFHPTRETVIAIMSTSGSTAKPKFVKFTHDMVVSIALELQLTEPRVWRGRTLILSPFFTGGLYVIFEYITLGCSQFVRTKLQGDELLDVLVQEKVSVFPSGPIFLERVAGAARFPEADLSSIIWATVGGARVQPTLVQKYREKGVLLRCLYGQTEAGGAWASTGESLNDTMSAGYGGPFTEWGIIKGEEFQLPGQVGEIVIRGPSVTSGYWNNSEATSQVLWRDGWLKTGDLGKVDEINSLTFVDRLKDIIISGGLNISAAELEAVINEVDGVAEVAVISAADEKFGETPLAVVYATKPVSAEAIVQHCNSMLADYKVPRYIVLESEPLPRNPSGKISKLNLREKYKDAAERLPKLR
jgi:fatty-acyl-CoA synthase